MVKLAMKATAKAPSNIAFIKYWGKENERLRIPSNSSISMNLSDLYTVTTVEFDPKLKADKININGSKRVSDHLSLVRKLAKLKLYATVKTENNFPSGAGIASSASGFAALSLAATRAAGLELTERGLSILARLGSGSACRSIPDGFVEWHKGSRSDNSYAYSLYPDDYWDIADVVAIVTNKHKQVTSSDGHSLAKSSPFFKKRQKILGQKNKDLKMALKKRDFTHFGEIIESEALEMHAIALTSKPPVLYWNGATVELMGEVLDWRNGGLEAYFTIDAGANLHVICQGKDANLINNKLRRNKNMLKVIVNKPAEGARIIEK